MLIPNTTIWETRIQNIDALVTAIDGDSRQVYYLATVCQVELDPPLVSIAPNPEYPICATIEGAGTFAIHFLGADQGEWIERTTGLDREATNKLEHFPHEVSARGTAILSGCQLVLECNVVRVVETGDHRTFIGQVVDRHAPHDWWNFVPHRFRGEDPPRQRQLKRVLSQSGVHDLVHTVRSQVRPPLTIAEGTGRYMHTAPEDLPEPEAPVPEALNPAEFPAERTSGRRLAPERPGICLVGCGFWGAVHALELERLGDRVRRYFVSRNADKARGFAGRFAGDGTFDNLATAAKDPRVDAVVLALPHHLHADAARQALAAGKHVLIEKPIAVSMAEGEALVAAADEAGVCLAVAEQYRLSPLVERVRTLLEENIIGRVTIVHGGVVGRFRPGQDWKSDRTHMGGGVLLDVGVHYVDMLRSWFGEPATAWAVSPPKLYEGFGGEDAAVCVLGFTDGPVCDLTISWSGFRAPGIPHFELIGEIGTLHIDFKRPYVTWVRPLPGNHWTRQVQSRLPWRLEEMARRHLPKATTERVPVADGDLIGSGAMIRDFVTAIASGGEPAVSGREGLRDLQVVLAAYEALQSGRPALVSPAA